MSQKCQRQYPYVNKNGNINKIPAVKAHPSIKPLHLMSELIKQKITRSCMTSALVLQAGNSIDFTIRIDEEK